MKNQGEFWKQENRGSSNMQKYFNKFNNYMNINDQTLNMP